MSPAPSELPRLRIIGDALAGLRDCARTGADEVLGLYPDVGDRQTQQAVESCLEDLAEILRLLDESTTWVIDDLFVIGGGRASSGDADDPSRRDEGARR